MSWAQRMSTLLHPICLKLDDPFEMLPNIKERGYTLTLGPFRDCPVAWFH